MDKWKELEFYYADLLRKSDASERRKLYKEAYSAVAKLRIEDFNCENPQNRTAGTSDKLTRLFSLMVDKRDRVLEVGCGRGYTCMKLAPYVKSMVGIDVSEPSIAESRIVLSRGNIKNVEIKLVSAFELVEYFTKDEFNVCLSIDVFEHLHPDDAKDHLQQVFQVLKPGGKYIIVTPNRLTGPHDITRDVFPEEREARGFHLNETTYSEIINIMRAIGFNKFRCFFPLKLPKKNIKLIIVPYNLIIIFESLYRVFPNLLRFRVLERLIAIHLIAYKPETF